MSEFDRSCYRDDTMDYLSFLKESIVCRAGSRGGDSILSEGTLKIPPEMGEGEFQRIEARNSLEIWRVKARLDTPFTLPFQLTVPRFEICYCRTGHVVIRSDEKRLSGPFSDGNYQINLMSFSGEMAYTPGVRQEYVSIMFYQDFLDSLPRSFLNFSELSEERKIELYQPRTAPLELKRLFEDILDCPFSDISLLFQLEGKGMEILSGIIPLHFRESRSGQMLSDLSVSEKDAVGRARNLIDGNLHRNISIRELSAEVGMNTHKLTSGFRKLYGTSINHYRKEIRMKKARDVLMSGERNISETAFQVGFQSVGHFTSDF